MSQKYTDTFIKVYINLRSIFTDYFSEKITDKDNLYLYALENVLKEYYNIKCIEENK